jgi:hypothetical protein
MMLLSENTNCHTGEYPNNLKVTRGHECRCPDNMSKETEHFVKELDSGLRRNDAYIAFQT